MARRRSRKQMDLTEFGLIQSQAEFLVASFRGKYGFPVAPPIPVEMIAKDLFGLRREFRRLGDEGNETLGALCVGEKVILVDDRCTHRQRYLFTLGHEIGHWVLHGGNKAVRLMVEGPEQLPVTNLLGSASERTAKARARLRDIEANRFAAALLMPRDFLREEAKKHAVLDQAAVAQLARAFDVSTSAMLFRVKDLSQHLQWTGPRIRWDALHRFEVILDVAKRTGGTISLEPTSKSRSDEQGKSYIGMQGQSRRHVQRRRGPEALRAFHYLGRFSDVKASGPLSSQGDAGADGEDIADSVREFGEDLGDTLDDYFQRVGGDRRLEGEAEQDRRAPLIIEFAGTPNSGKDTLIEIIKDYLEDGHGYRVRVCDEAIKFCHIQKQLSVDRLFKTVAQTVAQLYEARLENPGDYDFVIFNRGLFDRLAFLRALRVMGELSPQQERVHADYLLSYASFVDVAFLFLISEEESIRRENENGRGSAEALYAERDAKARTNLRTQRILHTRMLARLNESYLDRFRSCREVFNDRIYLFNSIDGGDASIIDKARALVDTTLRRNSCRQLVIPELFDPYYAWRAAPKNRQGAARRSPNDRPGPKARQLLLFRDGTAHGSVAQEST